ncbi:unnamed protein product, partial [Didymodactylos carnosus]
LQSTKTSTAMIREIDNRVQHQTSSLVYRDLVCTPEGVSTIKNRKQIQYRRQKHLNQLKLTQDDMFALYSIGLHHLEFVRYFLVLPQLVIICAHKQIIDLFNALLSMTTSKIVISYDTTFNLTDGYVSSLIYRHDAFESQPAIVLAYMIHETKQEWAHTCLVRTIKDLCSEMENKCVMISDNETAFKNAFQKECPKLIQLRCHTHLYRNIYRQTLKYRPSKKKQNNETTEMG